MVELRPERVVFRISGEDATHLLHDVLTTTVSEEQATARWFALLAPQGKILAEGLLGYAEGAYWLDVHESVAENFQKRMRMYRLRAKMEIEPLNESHVVGWSKGPIDGALSHRDGRGEGLGMRVIAARAQAQDWGAGAQAMAARIAGGILELGPDFDAESLFPHDIGMDQRGGVDFKKGCFVGQEVVSRMQHRNTARRRPVIVSGVQHAQRGAALTVDGKNGGTLGTPLNGRAVAIMRIDRIESDSTVMLGEAPVQLALPDWAGYRFADSAAIAEK